MGIEVWLCNLVDIVGNRFSSWDVIKNLWLKSVDNWRYW